MKKLSDELFYKIINEFNLKLTEDLIRIESDKKTQIAEKRLSIEKFEELIKEYKKYKSAFLGDLDESIADKVYDFLYEYFESNDDVLIEYEHDVDEYDNKIDDLYCIRIS